MKMKELSNSTFFRRFKDSEPETIKVILNYYFNFELFYFNFLRSILYFNYQFNYVIKVLNGPK